MNNDNKYLNHGDLKIWDIYWFNRKWLTEKESSKKGEYRPCIVYKITKKKIILVPLSSSKTSPNWNIEYESATRTSVSNIHIDETKVLDPRSISNSKVCKPLENVREKSKNAKLSSKALRVKIIEKLNDFFKEI